MKVTKFGGTSLADAAQIRKVVDIILSDRERKIVVVSAPGKRCKNDIKVTDLLINLGQNVLKGRNFEKDLNAVISRYSEIAQGLKMDSQIVNLIKDDLISIINSEKSNPNIFMDKIKAAGEDNCAKLIACYFNKLNIKAYYVNPKDAGLLVSDEYGNARVLPEAYEKLKCLLSYDGLIIFPGFFGFSPSGTLVTFSRGGSDITGSILAAAVHADIYENFTDVDCVYAAKPDVVKNPKPIPTFTYREMRELSYAGFSVFHEEALIPVYKAGIPVCIKNTNNPAAKGTMIVTNKNSDDCKVVGIASDEGFCSIYVSKYLMNREVGFGRKLLQILEDENIAYEHMPSGIDNISVIVRENQLTDEIEKRIVKKIKSELDIDYIEIEHNLALIMIVGEGMKNSIGIASRSTGALSKAGINLEMINQGFSESSMMFSVRGSDEIKAVNALYDEFFS